MKRLTTNCLLAAMVMVGTASCADSARRSDLRQTLSAFDDRGDPRLDARRRALQAQLEAQPVMTGVRRAELRLEGAELTDTGSDRGPQFEVRLPLQHPWRVGADSDIHMAQVAEGLHQLSQDALELEVTTCTRSARFVAHQLMTEAWKTQRDDLVEVERWLTELNKTQNLTDARLRSHLLAHKSRLLRTRPPAAPTKPEPIDEASMTLQAPTTPLDTSAPAVEALLLNHPLWSTFEAQQEHFMAMAQEAQARRIPWFQWLSFNFEPATDNREARVAALLSFALPLGLEERARAQSYDAQAEAIEWEARSVFELHRQRLKDALTALQAHEARIPELLELENDAEDAHRELLEWMKTRSITPQEAQSTAEDIFDLRRALVDERLDAALLRCEALALTGQPPSTWPRGAAP